MSETTQRRDKTPCEEALSVLSRVVRDLPWPERQKAEDALSTVHIELRLRGLPPVRGEGPPAGGGAK